VLSGAITTIGSLSISQPASLDALDLQKVVQDQGIDYVQTNPTGLTLTAFPDQPLDFEVQAVPEPSTWALLSGSFILSAILLRVRRKLSPE
jgi:hypothetical protein